MESALLEMKEKAGLRSALLEKKLSQLVSILEAKETEVHTLIMAANADPEAVKESRKNLEVRLKLKLYRCKVNHIYLTHPQIQVSIYTNRDCII